MYDIEFVIPVRAHQKYAKRIESLKQYGLINALDKKVLLTLLIGEDKAPGIEIGWGAGIEVNVVRQPFNLHVCKMFSYFSGLSEKELNRSRWFAKFDDDSVNDISGMVDNLDLEFDHEREYYIVTELRNEENPIDRDLAHKFGYGRWFQPHHKNVFHEKEGSVVSQAALKRILETPDSKRFLEARSDISDGWGDIGLAWAARMAKIYPCETNFLSSDPHVERFSMFGGDLNHIHYMAEDINPEQYNILKQRLFWNTNTDAKTLHTLTKNEYLFSKIDSNGKTTIISQIKLLADGSVQGSSLGPNETLWRMNNGNLEFLNPRCQVTTCFDKIEPEFTRLNGAFNIDPSVQHSLRVIL